MVSGDAPNIIGAVLYPQKWAMYEQTKEGTDHLWSANGLVPQYLKLSQNAEKCVCRH